MPHNEDTAEVAPPMVGPLEFSEKTFQDNGFSPEDVRKTASSKSILPPPEMIDAYTMELTQAVRDSDLAKLEALYGAGDAKLYCCNRFGNSLILIACRRGKTQVFQFLMKHAVPSAASFSAVYYMTDFWDRTPFHDSCWTITPNLKIVQTLLEVAPELALCKDKRGHTPFDYAREEHRKGVWFQFLSQRKHLLKPKNVRGDEYVQG